MFNGLNKKRIKKKRMKEGRSQKLRLDVLMAMTMKYTADFWGVTPCRLVGEYRRFGGMSCLHMQDINYAT